MQKSTLREYTESILIAAILALFIRTFVFQAFKIPTGSMENNLLVGDHILVNKFIFGPTATSLERWLLPVRPVQRSDVLVFRAPQEPDKDFIKRVVGLPGESVQVTNGVVYVNDVAQDEPFANHEAAYGGRHHDTDRAEQVGIGQYYVLGDNRDNSRDSRYWGSVPRPLIKGKAMLVYWSFEAPEHAFFPTSMGDRMVQFTDVVLHFFTRTRWDRSFHLIR
ncbi:MAG: signal peptidase I [Acidobacteriota bacterium]